MILEPGSVLACRDTEIDSGLWFIFYSYPDGAAAFDLTTAHPDIVYKDFQAALDPHDTTPQTEKTILLGGPHRSDDSLIILHETGAASPESTRLNDAFSFLTYAYTLDPDQSWKINLTRRSPLVIAMGYRVFEAHTLNNQIAAGQWICLPATTRIIFETRRQERRAKFTNLMN